MIQSIIKKCILSCAVMCSLIAPITIQAMEANAVGQAQQQEACPICVADLHNGNEICRLTCDVRHQFHRVCIAPWLAMHNSCPTCRRAPVFAVPLNNAPEHPQPAPVHLNAPHHHDAQEAHEPMPAQEPWLLAQLRQAAHVYHEWVHQQPIINTVQLIACLAGAAACIRGADLAAYNARVWDREHNNIHAAQSWLPLKARAAYLCTLAPTTLTWAFLRYINVPPVFYGYPCATSLNLSINASRPIRTSALLSCMAGIPCGECLYQGARLIDQLITTPTFGPGQATRASIAKRIATNTGIFLGAAATMAGLSYRFI